MMPFVTRAKVEAMANCRIRTISLKMLLAKPSTVVRMVRISGRPIWLAM